MDLLLINSAFVSSHLRPQILASSSIPPVSITVTMGVSESRVVIETLSAACTEAEENEKDNIEAPLTNEKVCL